MPARSGTPIPSTPRWCSDTTTSAARTTSPRSGIQGDVPKADQESRRAEQGYNCGLALVGHTTLDCRRAARERATPTWRGRATARTSRGPAAAVVPQMYTPPAPANGVAVVDVSNSAHPRHVGHAAHAGRGRRVRDDPRGHDTERPVDPRRRPVRQRRREDRPEADGHLRRLDDCTKLELHGHVRLAGEHPQPHDLARRPLRLRHQPLQAVDISALVGRPTRADRRREYLGNIQDVMAGPPVADRPVGRPRRPAARPTLRGARRTRSNLEPRGVAVGLDGTTLYVGGQTPEFEIFTILDLRAWLQRDADGTLQGPPRRRQPAERPRPLGAHRDDRRRSRTSCTRRRASSVPPTAASPSTRTRSPDRPSRGSPTSPTRAHPARLAVRARDQRPARTAPTQLDSGANQSVHYHDVDDPDDTTFVMASMWNAGIRVFDVRDPAQPDRGRVLQPRATSTRGRPRCSTTRGRTSATSPRRARSGSRPRAAASGSCASKARSGDHLGLDAKNVQRGLQPLNVPVTDPGAPGRSGIGPITLPVSASTDIAPYYCTLSSLTAPLQ